VTLPEHEAHNAATEQAIIKAVAAHACFHAGIRASSNVSQYMFSIGLWQTYSHPEVICFGLSDALLDYILQQVHAAIRAGQTFMHGRDYEGFIEGYPIRFLPALPAKASAYMGYCDWYYCRSRQQYEALQIVWPDNYDKWPWQKEYRADWAFFQPLLDRDQDFWFLEHRDTLVMSTRHVEEGARVRYVYHNADGTWQFHALEEPDMADACQLTFAALVQLDAGLNRLYDLERGMCAYRSHDCDDWIIAPIPEV